MTIVMELFVTQNKNTTYSASTLSVVQYKI